MEDRETARIRKYGESKTTRIMMATLPHVTSGSGLRKFQADGFCSTEGTTKNFNQKAIISDILPMVYNLTHGRQNVKLNTNKIIRI